MNDNYQGGHPGGGSDFDQPYKSSPDAYKTNPDAYKNNPDAYKTSPDAYNQTPKKISDLFIKSGSRLLFTGRAVATMGKDGQMVIHIPNQAPDSEIPVLDEYPWISSATEDSGNTYDVAMGDNAAGAADAASSIAKLSLSVSNSGDSNASNLEMFIGVNDGDGDHIKITANGGNEILLNWWDTVGMTITGESSAPILTLDYEPSGNSIIADTSDMSLTMDGEGNAPVINMNSPAGISVTIDSSIPPTNAYFQNITYVESVHISGGSGSVTTKSAWFLCTTPI